MKSDATDEIKARIDIHDLISEYVDLKRAGQNYKGLCPFHSEKTPSSMVNPSKQIFHCFGCNKGGDIFTFIMNYENMTFPEALSFLAAKAGVKLEDSRTGDPNKGLKESLYAIHEEALRFYKENLVASKHGLSYLKERGILPDVVERFSLGYAKSEKDTLMRRLKSAGFTDMQLKSSGLAYFGEGGAHDFFRDRIIFPIFDLRGKVVAFGGRTLSSLKNVPKYLNSPESPIFKKGESCYALNEAKNHISQKGYTIIVEGYFDVIVCHQFGFSNTVAPLGTALTPGHLRKLKKFSNKVLLTFDADNAGISAAKRTIELVYAESMIAKIVLLSEGEDPDTFLRKFGQEQFKKFIAKAATSVQFFLSRAGRSKIEGVRQFLNILSSCHDSLLRDDALRELSDLASERVLRQELANISAKEPIAGRQFRPVPGAVAYAPLKSPSQVPMSKEEEILLNVALSFPRTARRIAERLDIENLENPLAKSIFNKIIAAADGEFSLDDLIASFGADDQERTVISRLSIHTGIDMEEVTRNIEDCINKIALKGINKKISAAKGRGDADELRELLIERKKLMQAGIPGTT